MATTQDRRGMRSAFIIESTDRGYPNWQYWYETNNISYLPPCSRYPWRVMDTHGRMVAFYLPELHTSPRIVPLYARCNPEVTRGIPVTPVTNQILYLDPLEDA